VQARIGCLSWNCSCAHFVQGVFFASSLASVWCSATQDVAAATSIFSGFCEQYPGNDAGEITTTGTAGVASMGMPGQGMYYLFFYLMSGMGLIY